jgi:4-hydroxythreonine-4-phosphate dehydrogenase
VEPSLGKAAALCLEEAIRLARLGKIDGIVSSPLNKEAFHLAGYNYPDEVTWISEITQSREPFLLGLMGEIWTVAVTEHVPFRSIAEMITKDRVLHYICLLDAALKRIGLSRARIAVAALNVHAGEGGLLGVEEIEEIRPAVQMARMQDIEVSGPHPADTVFVNATMGEFDAVVCMYHDQANIARKLYARRSGATFFMGLPFPCGTTAHGTAFDIAGRGIVEPDSFRLALKYTALLARGEPSAGGLA